jgi:hypothetical protein
MRTHAEDTETTRLLTERDRIDARLAALGIDVVLARPPREAPVPAEGMRSRDWTPDARERGLRR